jgi:inosine/xanthosine triphosphatase
MIINIGSKNPAKIQAVRETLSGYPLFLPLELNSAYADSEIAKQPFGLRNIEKGSKNRARNCFEDCDYSIGLESGLINLPSSKYRFYDVCIASIFDGYFCFVGFSGGFEVPKKFVNSIIKEGIDLGEACQNHGLCEDRHIGSREGIVGILTNGRVNRKLQTQQALQMALTRLENPDFYK